MTRIFLVGIEMGGFHYPTVQLYSVCGLECEELFARHIQPRHLLLQLLIVSKVVSTFPLLSFRVMTGGILALEYVLTKYFMFLLKMALLLPS